MKKLLIAALAIFTLGTSSMSAEGTAPAVYDIDPYAMFDQYSNGQAFYGEYLTSYQQTSHDFSDRGQSQIVVWGYPTADNPYPRVNIGTSLGHYVGKQAIADQNGIIVGYVMGFNHYGVNQGYLQSSYNNVYDGTAYIR